MEITSDPRLRAGMRAALEHICGRHGLGEEDRHELVASVEAECVNDLRNGSANCAVTIDEMDDRVEVTVGPEKDSSGKMNSHEAKVAGHQSASHEKGNRDGGRTFVKHFQKNATHS